jgi:hypothetical protein
MTRGYRSSSSTSPAWRRLDAILLLVCVCCQTSVSALTSKTTLMARYVGVPERGGAVRGGRHSASSMSYISLPVIHSPTLLHFQQRNKIQLNMSPIGFVGLGIMGEGMAARLLSEGVAGSESVPLIIWNRTGSKCAAFKAKFPDKTVMIKDTAREVIEACGVTYSILSTPEASTIVFEGENGVLAGVSAGKSIVDCATLAEEDMKRMNEAVVAKGG